MVYHMRPVMSADITIHFIWPIGPALVIGCEIAELATNPLDNAWCGGNDPTFPTEVADHCEGVYGTGAGGTYIGQLLHDKNGAVYNMNGIRRRFLVQWIRNHLERRCAGQSI
ncbi:hypothetical protein L1987_78309 [Smallanthus sonchifolius]|uniref:Uncharacterized protein n=1 Tax=Smallanthus sonchifolius TaxID=185202 RepID=A0ACB8ZCB4_9ASTR|nr:hypothetical protein L1987_78309 [Smallanthus sonchifolius]